MAVGISPQVTHPKEDADTICRLGGWLFRQRTWLPVPLALALLTIPPEPALPPRLLALAGFAFVLSGELLRLWSVRHIGVISRTRSARLGPLVATGPFGVVRNPLYLGNVALWTGFALTADLVWMAVLVAAVLGAEYHAIVRWEERLLESRLGDEYRRYAASVPRWRPRWPSSRPPTPDCPYGWRDTLFSERGTLIAIAVGYALLSLKMAWYSRMAW